MRISNNLKSISRKNGFDHWLTLLIAAAIVIAVSIVFKEPLVKLITDCINSMKDIVKNIIDTL